MKTDKMKAIVYEQYGSPEVLALKEVEKPVPGDEEVLIKVQAASVNSWDWDLLTGKPYPYRLLFGVRKPKHPVIGSDVAGRVEAVGKQVRLLQPGDEVFGDLSGCGFGAFAEYVCVPENLLALKSSRMTFEQAAAIPQAGVLALQGLRQGKIQSGQKVLINGAGGGAGTFAVQLAKLYGATVTGVDKAHKLEMVRSLGADHVIDYTQEDFTAQEEQQYDLILDMVAARPLSAYKRALRPGGIFVMVGGSIPLILKVLLLGSRISKTRKMGILAHQPDPIDLDALKELFEAGKVVPVIDKRFPLQETADALRYFGEGNVLGKIVITL